MLANGLAVIRHDFIPDKTDVMVLQILTKAFFTTIFRLSGTDFTVDDQYRDVNHVTR